MVPPHGRRAARIPGRLGSMSDEPGRIAAGEMAEQPAMLRRILERGAPPIRAVAEAVAARGPRFVPLTARGTSGNAALYAKYLLEIRVGLPVRPRLHVDDRDARREAGPHRRPGCSSSRTR